MREKEGLWQPAQRSRAVREFYARAEDDRENNPERHALDLDRLMASARRNMGLDDFNGDDFRPAFQSLIDSMNQEAGLNAVGIKAAKGLVRVPLENRLKMTEIESAQPGIFARPIAKPVFIIGGSRTGTTLLQRLLAVDPANRAVMSWEMTSPAALGSDDPEVIKGAVARAQLAHDGLHFMNPAMKAVHFSGATLPEECVLMMGADGLNWGVISNMLLPSYAGYLATRDFTGAYEFHRRMLQVLQGDGPPARWVLKAPYHLPELAALLRVYPDARIIRTHRDMVETVASTASLFCTFRSTFTDRVDPVAAGIEQVELYEQWFERADRARSSLPAGSDAKFTDVIFKELAADPMGVVRRIYGAFDMELTPDARALMEDHLAEGRKGGPGTHRYSPDQFALNPGEVRERFADYEKKCGLA
jgi:hypothetical protein